MTVLKVKTLTGVPVLFVSRKDFKSLQNLPGVYQLADYALLERRTYDLIKKEMNRVFIGFMVE